MSSQEAAFATGIPPYIYAFHCYASYLPLPHSSDPVSDAVPRLSGLSIRLKKPPTRALRPVIPINACTLRITAAAGTELAGASSKGNVGANGY